MRVLNVGGGPRNVSMPQWYDDYEQIWLDIEPEMQPDILLDVREIGTLTEKYDAVYGSHILEHIYPHELQGMLRGAYDILTEEGFAEFRVPDCQSAILAAAVNSGNLYTELYESPAGTITTRDVLWGYAPYVERYGEPQAHKNGFTKRSLVNALSDSGFSIVFVGVKNFEIRAVAFKREPQQAMKESLHID